MKKNSMMILAALVAFAGFAQTTAQKSDSAIKAIQFKKDSTLQGMMHADSVKVNKEYAEKLKAERIKAIAIYPALNGGDMSGVVPVKDPTFIPDPTLDYKLMFDIAMGNPDSLSKEINMALTEASRIVNLHVASGIPLKKIFMVFVVHGDGLNAITTNEYYKEHFKTDNPNLKLISDLKSMGAEFIACGQAMAFMEMKKEALLPLAKITLSAKTAFSSYQLKGYVLF